MEAVLQEIRTRVLEAHARGTPLRLRGAGTKDFYGEQLQGELLSLDRWQGVVDYQPSELVLTVRCGTLLSTVDALLSQHGQYLPCEPPAFGGDPTVGGIVAAGLSGTARPRTGAVRDFVLGAVLLGPNGELLHFGGQVMKNVAGFDVSRLLCGSLGILGPILQVSLKVLPLPALQQTLRFDADAAQALCRFNSWRSQPLPIHACAWADGAAWVRLCGAESAVGAARQRLGGEAIELHQATQWWRSVRNHTHPFFQQGPSLWRVSVPANAPALTVPGATLATPLIEWSGALRWYAQQLQPPAIRECAQAAGGTASQWHGGTPGQRFHPMAAGVLRLHQRLKARFDPRGIYNRGRLVAGL